MVQMTDKHLYCTLKNRFGVFKSIFPEVYGMGSIDWYTNVLYTKIVLPTFL
jgi:hypothetical protein